MSGASGELVVLTVAYASQGALETLAHDLKGQRVRPHRWLVVDNAPWSAPLRIGPELAALPIERLEGIEGAGFGEGCNRGLEALAQGGWRGWVWLLNPDSRLLETHLVEHMASLLAACPDHSLVGTAVCDSSGELEASGGWIDPGLAFRRRRLGPDHRRAAGDGLLAVDWLSGCSLALKPSAWDPPPRFDGALPLYYEDMDLCLRLRARGGRCLWSPAVTIGHQRGSGSGGDPARRAKLTTTSYWRFLQRHTPGWVRSLRGLRLLATALVRLPINPGRSLAVLQGWVVAIREPMIPLR